MKKLNLIPIFVLLVSFSALSQEENSSSHELIQDIHLSSQKGKSTLGVGLGLQYGGIGGRYGINVTNYFGLFAGFGYNLVGLGYNLGLKADLPSSNSTQFYFVGMYGTNAAIRIKGYALGVDQYNKTYSGTSFGMGLKFNSRKSDGIYWDLGLLIPIRSSEFKNAMTELKNNPDVSDLSSPWPILVNVGINVTMK